MQRPRDSTCSVPVGCVRNAAFQRAKKIFFLNLSRSSLRGARGPHCVFVSSVCVWSFLCLFVMLASYRCHASDNFYQTFAISAFCGEESVLNTSLFIKVTDKKTDRQKERR